MHSSPRTGNSCWVPRARDVAGEAGDAESQDLMIGRITLHQKTIWMLKSFLKA